MLVAIYSLVILAMVFILVAPSLRVAAKARKWFAFDEADINARISLLSTR